MNFLLNRMEFLIIDQGQTVLTPSMNIKIWSANNPVQNKLSENYLTGVD